MDTKPNPERGGDTARGRSVLVVYFIVAALGISTLLLGRWTGQAASIQIGALLTLIGFVGLPLLFVPEHKRRAATRRLGSLALSSFIFVLVFFIAGEIALRIYFREGESFSSEGGPIVRRFEKDFRLNRFDGPSRGPEPSGPKLPGQVRLLIQGDSITWGRAVKGEENLYSSRLLAQLRESGKSVDMAVLARPGREIDTHVQQLTKWGEVLQPDIIIYQWYVNDLELDKTHQPHSETPWKRLFFHKALRLHSYLWCFLDISVGHLLAPPPGTYERYIASRYAEGTPAWSAFETQFTSWATIAKSLTPHVIVALYPHMSMIRGKPPEVRPEIAGIIARMRRLCDKQQVKCLDLWPYLARFDDAEKIMARPYDGHPSAAAHAVIASALYETLRAEWPDVQQWAHAGSETQGNF